MSCLSICESFIEIFLCHSLCMGVCYALTPSKERTYADTNLLADRTRCHVLSLFIGPRYLFPKEASFRRRNRSFRHRCWSGRFPHNARTPLRSSRIQVGYPLPRNSPTRRPLHRKPHHSTSQSSRLDLSHLPTTTRASTPEDRSTTFRMARLSRYFRSHDLSLYSSLLRRRLRARCSKERTPRRLRCTFPLLSTRQNSTTG